MLFQKKAVDWLIVGLGNPGPEYARTRHNVGFRTADLLAEQAGVKLDRARFRALVRQTELAGQRVLLLEPQTFMNNSGEAVQSLLHFYKLEPDRMIVLCDDIDLPLGSLRIRANGSAGTHNGMRSIIACVHSENFARIRIGVGKDESLLLRDFVLKRPSKAEQAALCEVFEHAADAAILIVQGNLNEAQMKYNKKHEKNRSVSIDGHKEE